MRNYHQHVSTIFQSQIRKLQPPPEVLKNFQHGIGFHYIYTLPFEHVFYACFVGEMFCVVKYSYSSNEPSNVFISATSIEEAGFKGKRGPEKIMFSEITLAPNAAQAAPNAAQPYLITVLMSENGLII